MNVNLIIILLLTITSFTNNVNAQNDSLNIDRKLKSIKSYTLGERFEKEGWDPKLDDFGKEICYTDRISLGSFEEVELYIFLTESDTIYKLHTKEISCGSQIDKAKKFRMDIQEFYNIEFKLLPTKPSTPFKSPFGDGHYMKMTDYIYVAVRNGIKYTLTSTNSGMGISSNKISMLYWKVSFSITDLSLENDKKQKDKIKLLQEQKKAKSNF